MVNHWEIALALYKEDKYSDLVVVCEDQKFNLHRAVVCPQSPFFERKCENDAQAGELKLITIPNCTPEDFERIVSFLYTGSYPDEDRSTNGDHAQARATNENHGSNEDCYNDDKMNQYLELRKEAEERSAVMEGGTIVRHFQIEARFKRRRGDPANLPHSISTSCRIYNLATKLEIPSLELVFRSRVCEALRKNAGSAHFVSFVGEIYNSALFKSLEVRELCCELLLNQYNKPEVNRRIRYTAFGRLQFELVMDLLDSAKGLNLVRDPLAVKFL